MSSREINGKVLTLSASGWTYFTRFVLYDYETESLWFPIESRPELTCVGGAYTDSVLGKFDFVVTSWKAWKADHPDSKFMDDSFRSGGEGCTDGQKL